MGDAKKQTFEPGKLRQFIAAVVVNLSTLSYGTMIGWQSPVTPQLQSADPPVGVIPMTDDEASWMSGTMCLAGTLVTFLFAFIPDNLGRKFIGYAISLPLGICWLLTIFATEHFHLYIARFFAGVGGAGALYVIPLYVSEISCDAIRGMLGSLLIFALNFGIFVAYILGSFLSFRVFAICSTLLPLFYFGLLVFMPESPVYLVRKNRMHEATRSLLWLKAGHKPTVERELIRLQAEAKDADASVNSVKFSDLFRDRATIKAVIITLGLFGGQQFCGIFAMVSYTETIFKISGSSISPNTAAIIVGGIQVLGSYISTSLMERTGRRLLLLISCFGMCLCHYILGGFCYLQDLEFDVFSFGWIPVVSLCFFMILYSMGMGPGPYVISSEIFARDVASLGITVGLLFVWLTAFIVVKFFTNLIAALQMYGCFFVLGTCCAGTFLFILLLLPETKGRPREEIVNELNGISCTPEKEYVSSKETLAISKISPPPERV